MNNKIEWIVKWSHIPVILKRVSFSKTIVMVLSKCGDL